VLAQDKKQWEKTIIVDSGPDSDLLELAADIRERQPGFDISTPARDATLEILRQAARGSISISGQGQVRIGQVLALLPKGGRQSVVRDVIDDMVGQSDASQIAKLIEVMGQGLTFEEEVDAERIVRRVFTPIVTSPDARSAAWMAGSIESRLDLFRDMPVDAKKDFGWRLRTAIQSKELDEGIAKSLTNAAGLLEIDLSQADEISSAPSASVEEPSPKS
jgi:hypothetical protein